MMTEVRSGRASALNGRPSSEGCWTVATMALAAVLLASAYAGHQAEFHRDLPVALSAPPVPAGAAR